jgi:hypothetical protein
MAVDERLKRRVSALERQVIELRCLLAEFYDISEDHPGRRPETASHRSRSLERD